MVDDEIDEPELDMMKFVTEDGITETAVKERVDFLCDIDDHVDGRSLFTDMFPTSKDVFKETRRDVFKQTMKYVKKLKKNNYVLNFTYNYGRDAHGVGRLYAQVGRLNVSVSQQMMRTSVRKYLQTEIYRDYDIKASYWTMLVRVCKRLELPCNEIENYLKIAQSPRRDEYLETKQTTKTKMNADLNRDNPGGFQRDMWPLFEQVRNVKRVIDKTYRARGYKPKDNSRHPISSVVSKVLGDEEKIVLLETVQRLVKENYMCLEDLGPIMFDGFNSKKSLPIDIMNTYHDHIEWAEKENVLNVNEASWRRLMDNREKVSFDITREVYDFDDDVRGPCVRQLVLGANQHINIMECSEKSMGKTFRSASFIKTMTEMESPQIVNVLIIYHRISLVDDAFNTYWKELGFVHYTELKGKQKEEAGLDVTCINSLHLYKSHAYDLIVIDEIPEVLESIVTMNNTYKIHDNLSAKMKQIPNRILMSADSDKNEFLWLQDLGLNQQISWQMNRFRKLNGYTYKFSHFEDKDMEYQTLFDAIDNGENVVIPCTTKRRCLQIEQQLKERYGKDFVTMVLHGDLSDQEKRDRQALCKTSKNIRALIHTSVMESGVSINICHYHSIFFFMGSSTNSAKQIMQMVLRVRNLMMRDGSKCKNPLITFICDRTVKDWKRLPGFFHDFFKDAETGDVELSHEQLANPHIIVLNNCEFPTMKSVMKYVFSNREINIEDEFFWKSPKDDRWRHFVRHRKPAQVTYDVLVEALKRDRGILSLINNTAYEIPNSLKTLISDADAEIINLTASQENKALTNLIIRTRCKRLNQYRDMVSDLIRLIGLQDSLYTHEILCRDEDDIAENKTTGTIKLVKEKMARKTLQSIHLKNQTMNDLRSIVNKREKNEIDKQALDYAFAKATWGDEHLEDIIQDIPSDPANLKNYSHGVIPHVVMLNKARQKQFLQLCMLMKPHYGFQNPECIIEEMAGMTDRDVENETVTKQQRLFAYCNILHILGFSDPNDCSLVESINVTNDGIEEEIKALTILRSRKRKKSVCDPLKSIQGIFVEAWGISPKISEEDPHKLKLVRTPTSLCYPGYSYERYEKYTRFLKLLYGYGSEHDPEPESEPEPDPNNFFDVVMGKQAQQEVREQHKKQQEKRKKKKQTQNEPVRQESNEEMNNRVTKETLRYLAWVIACQRRIRSGRQLTKEKSGYFDRGYIYGLHYFDIYNSHRMMRVKYNL